MHMAHAVFSLHEKFSLDVVLFIGFLCPPIAYQITNPEIAELPYGLDPAQFFNSRVELIVSVTDVPC